MSYSTRRSYGGFNRGSLIQKPVEVGKQHEVDVTQISRKGGGIAKAKVARLRYLSKMESWK